MPDAVDEGVEGPSARPVATPTTTPTTAVGTPVSGPGGDPPDDPASDDAPGDVAADDASTGDPASDLEAAAAVHDPAHLVSTPGDTPVVRVAHLDWRSGAWVAGGLFVAFVLVGLMRNIPGSVTRIAVGLLLALALDPVVVRVRERLRCSRAVAVAVVSTGVGVLFALLVFVLGPPAIEQAEEFGRELPRTVEDAYSFPLVGGWLEERDAADEVRDWAADLPAEVDTESVTDVARSVLDGVLAALMVLVVGLAVLIDADRLIGRLQAALPDEVEGPAVRVGRTFRRTLGAYFAGSLLVASLAAIFILAVGLAFGVPLAPAAALWMLVVNLIPQIGGFLGGGFFVVLGLTRGLGTGLACLVLFLIYQNLENHVIQPVVVGQAVDLSPPTTMLAALVGGAAAGVPGALVATPLAGAAKSLYMELRWGREPPPASQALTPPWRRRRRKVPPSDGDAPADPASTA